MWIVVRINQSRLKVDLHRNWITLIWILIWIKGLYCKWGFIQTVVGRKGGDSVVTLSLSPTICRRNLDYFLFLGIHVPTHVQRYYNKSWIYVWLVGVATCRNYSKQWQCYIPIIILLWLCASGNLHVILYWSSVGPNTVSSGIRLGWSHW